MRPRPCVGCSCGTFSTLSVTSDRAIDALRGVIGERNIGYPVGVAVAAEYDRVADLMLRDVVEDAVAVGAVPVPGVEVNWR
jgi:hypothetical protein